MCDQRIAVEVLVWLTLFLLLHELKWVFAYIQNTFWAKQQTNKKTSKLKGFIPFGLLFAYLSSYWNSEKSSNLVAIGIWIVIWHGLPWVPQPNLSRLRWCRGRQIQCRERNVLSKAFWCKYFGERTIFWPQFDPNPDKSVHIGLEIRNFLRYKTCLNQYKKRQIVNNGDLINFS